MEIIMITINELRKNKEVLCYINQADNTLKEMGFTEHALPHVETCVSVVTKILSKLSYTDEEIKMIRAYLYVMAQIQLEIENNETNTKEE